MRGGLRQRLFWIVTLIALVPLLVLSAMGYVTVRGGLVASVRQNLRGLASLQVLQLNDYFRERRRQLKAVAKAFRGGESQGGSGLQRQLRQHRSEAQAAAVGWIGPKGQVKGWVGSGRPSELHVAGWRGVQVLGVFHFSKVSETVVRMAAPLRGQGWLLIDFPFSIHQRFLQEKQAPAFRGDILLLNRKHLVMCGSFDLKHSHHLFGSRWLLSQQVRGSGRWGRVFRYQNAHQKDVFGVALPMREAPWILLIELPVSRAFVSLFQLRRWGILLLLSCVLLLLGVVAWHAARVDREQRRVTAQLIQQEKMAALGLMATGVAHEIGNPLASVTMLTQRLLMSDHDEATTTRLQELDERCQTIGRILETLRDYASERSPQRVPMDVGQELRRAISLVRFDRRLHEIEIAQDISGDLPMVWGREGALQQVFANVLLNAIDAIDARPASPESPLPPGTINVRAWPTQDGLMCHVCDNGVGFSPGMAQQIFVPFVTSKPQGKGTGLGLTVSQQMIEDMGGRMAATRAEDVTCIELYLPMHGPSQPRKEH